MSRALRIDPHVKVLDESVVRRAKRAGLDALVYAPHFTRLPDIRERAAEFSDADLLVVPGREVFTGSWRNRKHVLAIGLDEPVPDFVTLAGAMDEFARQDAAVLVPHPTFMTVSLGVSDLRTHRDQIHAVETYNPKHLSIHNHRSTDFAEDLGIPAFASSYAHLRGTVGEAWTTFRNADATEDAIVDAVKRGVPRSTGHRSGFGHRLRRVAEFSHLLYENSWEKFDRVVRSGRESTHPRHPAYGGRFDDVAEY